MQNVAWINLSGVFFLNYDIYHICDTSHIPWPVCLMNYTATKTFKKYRIKIEVVLYTGCDERFIFLCAWLHGVHYITNDTEFL